MLDRDYAAVIDKLLETLKCRIRLPETWDDFFRLSGPAPAYPGDERAHQRIRVRAAGLLYFERPLPTIPRPAVPSVIYTSDVSRRGLGLIADTQIFPEEVVRVVLPSFWVRMTVMRCSRVGPACYNFGGTLLSRMSPGREAFLMPNHSAKPATAAN